MKLQQLLQRFYSPLNFVQDHPGELAGATENAGVENAAPSKMQGWKTREWKTRHQMTWVENAGVENVAPDDRGGKRGSGKPSKATSGA